jgi:hypothetical protein
MIVRELSTVDGKKPIRPAIPAVDLILGQDPQIAGLVIRKSGNTIGVQTVALRVGSETPFSSGG